MNFNLSFQLLKLLCMKTALKPRICGPLVSSFMLCEYLLLSLNVTIITIVVITIITIIFIITIIISIFMITIIITTTTIIIPFIKGTYTKNMDGQYSVGICQTCFAGYWMLPDNWYQILDWENGNRFAGAESMHSDCPLV